jgi:hypothetical protein
MSGGLGLVELVQRAGASSWATSWRIDVSLVELVG